MNVLNKEVLSPITLSNWLELQKNSSSLEGKIINRIGYIVRKIHEFFEDELSWWDFPGDGKRGEGGLLINALNNITDEILFQSEINGRSYKTYVVILSDNSKWDLSGGFPRRWLFENFEEELIEGKEKFEIAEKIRLQEKNKMLAAQARAKLSKEELAALKKEL